MEKRKLISIITESALESRLLDDLARLGARGCTVLDARGRGARGARNADWDQSQNVKIEVICDAATAETIAQHCRTTFGQHYAMVLYLSDVEVFRPEKF